MNETERTKLFTKEQNENVVNIRVLEQEIKLLRIALEELGFSDIGNKVSRNEIKIEADTKLISNEIFEREISELVIIFY